MKIPMFDYITTIISILLLGFNIKKIVRDTRYVIYCIFFVFFVFPLILDCFIMPPQYIDVHREFTPGQMDLKTRIIYDVLILILQFFLLYFKKNKIQGFSIVRQSPDVEYPQSLKILFVSNLLIGPVIALLNGYPFKLFFVLQAREGMREIWNMLNLKGYTYVEMFTYSAVASGLLLIFESIKNLKKLPYTVFYILFLYINLCLEGKRAIILFAIIVSFLIFLMRPSKKQISVKKEKRKFYWILTAVIIIGVFSIIFTVYVNQISRGMRIVELNIIYEVIRVDFLRDDRVRMAIFSILHPERQKVLDYPMQSMLIWPFFIVPFDYVARRIMNRVYTYTYYISAVLKNTSLESADAFMTPTIFAELISNMGIVLGTVVMASFCWKIIRMSKKYEYPYNVLIIMCFVQFLMFDIAYIMLFVEFVLLAIAIRKYNIKFIVGNRKRQL